MNINKRQKRYIIISVIVMLITIVLFIWLSSNKEMEEHVLVSNKEKLEKDGYAPCYKGIAIGKLDTVLFDSPDIHEATFSGRKSMEHYGCYVVKIRKEGVEKDLPFYANYKEPLSIRTSGKVDYYKRHKIARDIYEKDTIVYVMVRNMVDLTSEFSKYPSFEKQSLYLNKFVTSSFFAGDINFWKADIRLIAESQYNDSLPNPDLTVELYIKEFALTKGKRREWQTTYYAETSDNEHHFADIVVWEKYIRAFCNIEFRVLDSNCQLIVARSRDATYTHSASNEDYYGDLRVAPRIYINKFSNPRVVPAPTRLRNDEWVAIGLLKKAYTEGLVKVISFLNPLILHRRKSRS